MVVQLEVTNKELMLIVSGLECIHSDFGLDEDEERLLKKLKLLIIERSD